MAGPAYPANGPAPKERPPARSSTSRPPPPKPPVKSTGNSSAVPDDGMSSIPLQSPPPNRSVPSLPTSSPIRPAAIQAQSDIAPPAGTNATAINHGSTNQINNYITIHGTHSVHSSPLPTVTPHGAPPPQEQPYINANGSSVNAGRHRRPDAQETSTVGAQALQTSSEPAKELPRSQRSRGCRWTVFQARRRTMVITGIVLLLFIVGAVIGGVLGSRKKEATDEEASGGSGTAVITTDKILTTSVVVTTNGVASTSDVTTTQETVSRISRTSATEVPKPTKSANSNFLFPVEKKVYRILNDDDDTPKALAAPGIGDEVMIQPPSAELYQLWQVAVGGSTGEGMNGMVYSIWNVVRARHIIADVMIDGQSGQNTSALRLGVAPLEPASLWYFEAPYVDKEHSKKALLNNVMLSGRASVGWDGDKAEMEPGGYREWYLEEVDVPGV